MFCVSIVTHNRLPVLQRMLRAIEALTPEPHTLLITDNGSEDGTAAWLRGYAEERKHVGIALWLLPENVGRAPARNAHWDRCVGQDAAVLDDKIEVLSPYWLSIMREQAYRLQSLVAFTDPETEGAWQHAGEREAIQIPQWKCGAGLLVPAPVSAALGYWCEDYGLYGHDDLDYMDRAEAIGWKFTYTLKARASHLARAGVWGREYVKPFVPVYEANREAYREGRKDIAIGGRSVARDAEANPLFKEGTALERAWP